MWRTVLLLLVAALFDRAVAGVFDYSEFDDPFSAIWNVRNRYPGQTSGNRPLGIFGFGQNVANFGQNFGQNVVQNFLPQLGAPCVGTDYTGNKVSGVCTSTSKCKGAVGTPAGTGNCPFPLQTCCISSLSCGATSRKKVTYISQPGSFQTSCRYTIEAHDQNVCQVRIDFVQFSLLPPKPMVMGDITTPFSCSDDSLQISTSNSFNVPIICGPNAGQHMYIPMNATNGERTLSLQFLLKNRASNNLPGTPAWSIKITQLECPVRKLKLSTAVSDFYQLAPSGCLQYFTDVTGTVNSLGYAGNNGAMGDFYTGGLDYAICFRRPTNYCGIRYDFFNFNLGTVTNCGEGDYLYIPQSQLKPPAPDSTNYICGVLSPTAPATSVSVRSVTPGPFWIHFHTNPIKDEAGNQNGFSFTYTLLQTCS